MFEYSAFTNYLIIKVDTLFESHVKFKGVDGKDLVMDTSFSPERHARIYGEVMSVPHMLTNARLLQEYKGIPGYHESVPYTYKNLNDIHMDVRPGDKVYYHFNMIKPQFIIAEEGRHPNRVWYLKIRYDQILALVRDGQIVPVGGYTLVDPDFETWKDILVPTMSNIMDKDGKPQLKPESQWLQRKVAPGYHFLTGFVKHIGKPLMGDETEIEVGQKVWYRLNADWQVKIEGRDYFVVRQRHIIGKQVDGKFSPTRNYMLVEPITPRDTSVKMGLKVKPGYPKKGYVHTPGRNKFEVGQLVDFGQCNRTELELDGKKLLHINGGDCFAFQKTVAL